MFCEKGVLKNLPDFTGKHLCWNLFLVKLNAFSGLQIYQNKNRLQYRFFCEIFKNTYFEEHLRTTASKLLFWEKPRWLNKMKLIVIVNTFRKDRSSRPKLFCKNVVFKNSQNSQQSNVSVVSFWGKHRTAGWLTRDSNTGIFPLSFTNIFKTPILKNFCEWLLTVWK